MILFDDMDGVVEPTPIETVFVTQMCRVEDVGAGMMLSSFCAPIAGERVLRARFLIPISCGAIMNIHGTEVLSRALRSHPELVRKLMQF